MKPGMKKPVKTIKTPRKLTLDRETLRQIAHGGNKPVGGGTDVISQCICTVAADGCA